MAFCRNCGQQLPEGTNFCQNCGTAVGANEGMRVAQTGYQAAPPPVKKPAAHRWGFLWCIALFILAIVDYNSDPAIVTIVLSVIIIIGAAICNKKKFKLRLFASLAFLVALFCLVSGVFQAKKVGLFKNPTTQDYVEVAKEITKQAESIIGESKEETPVKTTPAETVETSVVQEESQAVPESTEKTLVTSEAAETPESESVVSVDGVNPELKAYLDSYEAFMDEYIDFMQRYTSDTANALSMMNEYFEILEKYDDFAEKIDAYDEETMSDADYKYYMEVMYRVNMKLLEIY